MNKKRWFVIAIALFLVIGTGSFVFANPSDISLNGKEKAGSNSSSQTRETNPSGTEENNNTMQNENNMNSTGSETNGENVIGNGDINQNITSNPMNENGIVKGNTTTNTSQNNNNSNAGGNNPSNTGNGGNNSQNSSSNSGNNGGDNNNDSNNGNNNSGNSGNSGSSSNPGNQPTEPEKPDIPDVVDPKPSTPEEKPTNNFVFANQKHFTENKIEIQDENYVSITIRNLSKTNDKPYTTTDRVIEINEYDTFKFTVCYRNLSKCQIYIMTHDR